MENNFTRKEYEILKILYNDCEIDFISPHPDRPWIYAIIRHGAPAFESGYLLPKAMLPSLNKAGLVEYMIKEWEENCHG